ncbi:ERO1-domain-containing protein [Bimuria novae-zelandiae CBS 107.79]|uniref:ERO1-domain-containing protein n=1 Tax=Bimuria novae-zelandiae CBS 107.79 TaxID=1447943 RepID=A0A6A5UVE3_9PLEO|nr:ERO1-domain-containing protein [Bimuria novae-zelandiae CBS 107.79]
MRTAAHVFYLAVFSLLGSSHAASQAAPSKSKDAPADVCDVSNRSSCTPHCNYAPQGKRTNYTVLQFEPGAIVSDACASYNTLEQLNEAIHPYLHSITQNTDFFSHYRLSLYSKKCPFWDDDDGMCGNRACAVNTLENEEDIPLVWRAKELGKLEGPTAQHPGKKQQREHRQKPLQGGLGDKVDESCVVEYDDECDDRDYCIPDDASATAKGDYVSLVDNPERFTGYAGVGAHQVWEAIYRENCFSKPPKGEQSTAQSSFGGASPLGGFNNPQQLQAANQLRNVMKEQAFGNSVKSAIAKGADPARLDPIEFDDTCLEKRVFHRVISGMHASISTHLCWDYLNQTTGEWGPNLACYEQRLHKFPDRVSNIYFNYALVMRAVGKIKQHIKDFTFCSEDPEQDMRTKHSVLRLASALPDGPEIFDETVMFRDPDSALLKEDFRNRFRNVSRIMDCVGCDKCRLWGKIQTNGYGTALKVLFEFDEKDSSKDPPLRRTELVALVNTMHRLSHSLSAIKEFRHMVEDRDGIHRDVIPTTPETEKEVEKVKQVLGDGSDCSSDDASPTDDGMPEKPDFTRNWNPDNMTFAEEFWAEFDLVYRAWKYVLRKWLEMPGTLAPFAERLLTAESVESNDLVQVPKHGPWRPDLPPIAVRSSSTPRSTPRTPFMTTVNFHSFTPLKISISNKMAANIESSALLASLSKTGLLPSPVIPETFKPSVELSVSFGEKPVVAGNLLRVSEVKDVPSVSFTPEPNTPSSITYTFLMIDPDAPTPDDPKFAYWRHWVVSSIPASSPNVQSGKTLTQYLAPGPKDDSKPHRYHFLLYREPEGMKKLEKGDVGGEEFVERRSFPAKEWVGKWGLELVGVNWMLGAGDGWVEG